MQCHAYVDRISLDHLAVVDRPEPEPGPHDIVIAMRAVSLNFRDLAIASGHYHVGVTPPLIPVSDGAGEVVRVGAQVTRFQVGDLACPTYLPDWIDGPLRPALAARRLGGPTDGVLADQVLVHEDAAVRAPRHLDAAEAATLPIAAVTAWHALHHTTSVRPGDAVLVVGTGGVSLAALAFARLAGARVVIAARSDAHRAALRTLGAAHVVTTTTERWPDEVAAWAGGGVDLALDVVGGRSLAGCIAATRTGGHVHGVGYVADTTATIDIFEAIRHATTLHVATAGPRASFEALARAMELHATRPTIGARFPRARLRDAFAHLGQRGTLGKVVVEL